MVLNRERSFEASVSASSSKICIDSGGSATRARSSVTIIVPVGTEPMRELQGWSTSLFSRVFDCTLNSFARYEPALADTLTLTE